MSAQERGARERSESTRERIETIERQQGETTGETTFAVEL